MKNQVTVDPFVGDLTFLKKYISNMRVEGNWVTGKAIGYDDAEVQVKIFAQGSEYGLEGGRISKLWLRDNKTYKVLANFDRRWDQKPKGKKDMLYVAMMIKEAAGE